MQMPKTVSLLSQQIVWLAVLSCAASAGTLSPEFKGMSSTKTVEVIVKYSAGDTDVVTLGRKLADLPGGGLYSMTVAQAKTVAAQPTVKTVSTNRTVYSTGTAAPVYDFMPQS